MSATRQAKRRGRHRKTTTHDSIVRAWFIEPFGSSVTEPMTVVHKAGEDNLILIGDLETSRKIMRESTQEAGLPPMVEINGVAGLAATDPHWDGQPTFVCKNPHCNMVHDVHENCAANLFKQAAKRSG